MLTLFQAWIENTENLATKMSSVSLNNLYRNYKLQFFPALLEDPKVAPEDKQKIRELLQKPWNPYIRRHSSCDELEWISNFRKLMLLYKLRHFDDEFKDVQLNVINRDKELTHSLISLFYGTSASSEIIRSLGKFLTEKKERKMETLEAEFFNIVNDFMLHPEHILEYLPEEPYVEEGKRLRTIFSQRLQNDNVQTRLDEGIAEVPFAAILTKFMESTDSVYKYGEDKKGTITSDEYGDITIQNITGILKDRFGGQPYRHKRYHYYKFSKSIVSALTDGYRTLEPLKILEQTQQKEESSDRSGDGVTD